MPEPPVCSMVRVYSATFPQRSVAVMFVVFRFSVSGALAPAAAVQVPPPERSPAATGLVSALVGLIRQARCRANRSESRVRTGTCTNAGSPT